MANPAAPREESATGAKMGYGIHDTGAADEAAIARIVDAAVLYDETVPSGALAVGSHTDHDAVDVGGPVKIGGRAQEPTTAPDEVANDDRVDALLDRVGRMAVYGGYPGGSVAISAAGSGDNTLLAAQAAGKKIAVWSFFFVVDGAVTVRFEDGASGTALTGVMSFTAAGEGIAQSAGGQYPLFTGTAATLLNLELGGAVQVSGGLSYSVIDD